MFTERTKNTLKQSRKVTLEEKWPEVRKAQQPKAIQEGTHSEREETHRNGELIQYNTDVSYEENEDLRTDTGELLRPNKKPWKSHTEEYLIHYMVMRVRCDKKSKTICTDEQQDPLKRFSPMFSGTSRHRLFKTTLTAPYRFV